MNRMPDHFKFLRPDQLILILLGPGPFAFDVQRPVAGHELARVLRERADLRGLVYSADRGVRFRLGASISVGRRSYSQKARG